MTGERGAKSRRKKQVKVEVEVEVEGRQQRAEEKKQVEAVFNVAIQQAVAQACSRQWRKEVEAITSRFKGRPIRALILTYSYLGWKELKNASLKLTNRLQL